MDLLLFPLVTSISCSPMHVLVGSERNCEKEFASDEPGQYNTPIHPQLILYFVHILTLQLLITSSTLCFSKFTAGQHLKTCWISRLLNTVDFVGHGTDTGEK